MTSDQRKSRCRVWSQFDITESYMKMTIQVRNGNVCVHHVETRHNVRRPEYMIPLTHRLLPLCCGRTWSAEYVKRSGSRRSRGGSLVGAGVANPASSGSSALAAGTCEVPGTSNGPTFCKNGSGEVGDAVPKSSSKLNVWSSRYTVPDTKSPRCEPNPAADEGPGSVAGGTVP
jgi:hypothetical protein